MSKLIYGTNSVSVEDPKKACELVNPVLKHIFEGWGYKDMSTTTEKIIKFTTPGEAYHLSLTYSDMRKIAELLERAAKLLETGGQRALFHPFVNQTEVDKWLADFEKFQNGK